MPRGYGRIFSFFRKLGLDLEILNTRLPEPNLVLKSINNIPKMSTYAIGAIINKAVNDMNGSNCFVNVGLWNGYTFFAGLIGNELKKCIGVDNFSEFGGPKEAFLSRFNKIKSEKHYFYEMDYRDYFKNNHQDKIGVYIYDGEHSYKNQLEGLRMAEPFFSDDCLIIIDDTNKKDPRNGTMDFINQSKYKYSIIFDQKTAHNGHPTFWNGLMVLKRVK